MDFLVGKFHALEGDIVPAKRKSFNHLLIEIQQQLITDEDLNAFVAKLKPKNKLEEILKVEILQRFRRNDALTEVLKSGDVVLIRKVLNCWKFFETNFAKIDPETLVEDLLPQTSFSTRSKIITKLAANLKNDALADTYFAAIKVKYGLQVASAILPACSLDVIKTNVKIYQIKMTARQLLKIYRKDREFLDYYFGVHYKNQECVSHDYDFVIRHVARVDADLFWKLVEKFQFDVKFGRHMTSYLYSKDVGKKIKAENFSPKQIYSMMKGDETKLGEFFAYLCPKEIHKFVYSFAYDRDKFLNCIPKSKKYTVVNYGFKLRYGRNLIEYERHNAAPVILEIVPEKERAGIVEQIILKNVSFMYLLPTEDAIHAIKERIRYTKDKNKHDCLVQQLYKTSKLSGDPQILLGVLKYVRSRFKNQEIILTNFAKNLSDWKHMEALSCEHWSEINALVKPVVMNSKIFTDFIFTAAFFKHAMIFGCTHDDFLKFYVKKIIERNTWYYICHEKRNFDERHLELMAALIPKIFEGEDYQKAAVWLLMCFCAHNKRSPKRKILTLSYPNFVQVVKSHLSKENAYDVTFTVRYLVLNEYEFDADYDRIFWAYYERLHDAEIIVWFLRNKPLRLIENIEQVVKQTSTYTFLFFKILSLYSFCSVKEKVTKFAMESLATGNISKTIFATKALIHFADIEVYLEATKALYPPDDGKIDYDNVDKTEVENQEVLANSLVGLRNPSDGLGLLMKFCKGDYLKCAYRPLYYLTACTPEANLTQFLEEIFDSAVSVRKHAVSIITQFCSKKKVHDFLKRAASDNHPTLQKTVLKNTLKYFAADQSDEFWLLLQQNVKIINADDTEAYELLLDLRKIPSKYLPSYIQMVYEILSNHGSGEIQKKKWDLVFDIPDDVFPHLDDEFLKNILNESQLSKIEFGFWLKCIFNTAAEKRLEMLEFCFDILQNYFDSEVSNPATGEMLRCIHHFATDFCFRAATGEAVDENLIKKFVELWESVVTSRKFYDEQLYMQLIQNYLTCRSENKLAEFGFKANDIMVNWVEEYGDESVLHLFAEILGTFLDSAIGSSMMGEKLPVFLETFCSSYNNYVVAMKLLSRLSQSVNVAGRLGEVIEKISACDAPSVRVRLAGFLKTLAADQQESSRNFHSIF